MPAVNASGRIPKRKIVLSHLSGALPKAARNLCSRDREASVVVRRRNFQPMHAFDSQPRTRIIFGADGLASLGDLAVQAGAHKTLLVSDRGVIAAGHTQRGIDALRAADIEVTVVDDFGENPTTKDVQKGVAGAQACAPELRIGLGGGSSMDCAKGINFVYTNGGTMHDYLGVGKAKQPMLPMFAVPTTSGTGSETQSFALISDAETKVKMACGDKKAACAVALLDPVLTLTQPVQVTALTGIDALAHALETYVTTARTPMSQMFSREAWRLLSSHLASVLDDAQDLEARGGMQLGACFAGLAIENSMLGATHALANPLTAEFGLIHGQAVGVMLPHVIRYNGVQCGDWYQELLQCQGGELAGYQGVNQLADWVSGLLSKAGLKQCLADCGVQREELARLSEDAERQWTAGFNPRPVSAADLYELYCQAF